MQRPVDRQLQRRLTDRNGKASVVARFKLCICTSVWKGCGTKIRNVPVRLGKSIVSARFLNVKLMVRLICISLYSNLTILKGSVDFFKCKIWYVPLLIWYRRISVLKNKIMVFRVAYELFIARNKSNGWQDVCEFWFDIPHVYKICMYNLLSEVIEPLFRESLIRRFVEAQFQSHASILI